MSDEPQVESFMNLKDRMTTAENEVVELQKRLEEFEGKAANRLAELEQEVGL